MPTSEFAGREVGQCSSRRQVLLCLVRGTPSWSMPDEGFGGACGVHQELEAYEVFVSFFGSSPGGSM